MCPDSPSLNSERLKDMTEGDRDFLEELVMLYLEDADEQIAGIRAALESSDAKTLERRAHSLKGASANVGAERMREIAYEMEMAGKGEHLADAWSILERIQAELPRVAEALRAL